MKITRLEEFQIWQLARRFAEAVSALLERPSMQQDRRLAEELADSSASVLDNSGEGFGQQSDRAFARHLYIARGSNNEARSQLIVALARHHITPTEFATLEDMSQQLGRMITALLRHLQKEDRRYRG